MVQFSEKFDAFSFLIFYIQKIETEIYIYLLKCKLIVSGINLFIQSYVRYF